MTLYVGEKVMRSLGRITKYLSRDSWLSLYSGVNQSALSALVGD